MIGYGTFLEELHIIVRGFSRSAAALEAGIAKVEITPPVGTPMAGYGKRWGRPSTGIRDPLYVRTLALGDGERKLLLISADLLVFPPHCEHGATMLDEEVVLIDTFSPPRADFLARTAVRTR